MMHEQPTAADPAARTRLYAVGFAAVFPTLLTYVYFVYLAERPSGVQQTVYTVGKAFQFAFPLWWVSRFHRARFVRALPSRRDLIEGVSFGAVVAAAMLALYALVLKPNGLLSGAGPAVQTKLQAMGLDSLAMFLAAAVFYSLIHSLLEEYYWRWFVFGELRIAWPLAAAITISSLGFMAHHVIVLGMFLGWQSPLTYLFSLCIAIGGAVWAWLYQRSGNLYGPWVSHLLVDAAIFAIGYDLASKIL